MHAKVRIASEKSYTLFLTDVWGIVYWELFNLNNTITTKVYCIRLPSVVDTKNWQLCKIHFYAIISNKTCTDQLWKTICCNWVKILYTSDLHKRLSTHVVSQLIWKLAAHFNSYVHKRRMKYQFSKLSLCWKFLVSSQWVVV